MKQALLLIISILMLYTTVEAQPKRSEIEKYIEKAREDWSIPGMSVAIVKDGEVFLNRGFGTLKSGEDQKVDENTLFAIASNTKGFVSSAIGVLVDEGKLDFDTRVQKIIPEFELYDSYVTAETTVSDLLCHRVGLGTYSGDIIWYKSSFSSREVIGKIKYVPKKFGFRNGYGYSNLMFITAGEVIKEVSGKTWDEYVKDQFFNPIGMDRTITSVSLLDQMGNFAIPHKPVDDQNLPIQWVNWDNMGAAGGIISSSSDMAKWLIFQLNQGVVAEDTILHTETQNVLWTTHNNHKISTKRRTENPGTNFSGYGLGWAVRDYYGSRVISHGGGYDGMYSQVTIVPELNLGFVILTNTMKGVANPLQSYLLNAFMEREFRDYSADALEKAKEPTRIEKTIAEQKEARVPNTRPAITVESIIGNYQTNMLGNISIVEENEDIRLIFAKAPDLSATLKHWHYDTWQIEWDQVHAWFDFGTIQFHHDNNMKVIGFEFDVPNYDIFFHELKVEKDIVEVSY